MFFFFKLKQALKQFWEEAESRLEHESVFVHISSFLLLLNREATQNDAKRRQVTQNDISISTKLVSQVGQQSWSAKLKRSDAFTESYGSVSLKRAGANLAYWSMLPLHLESGFKSATSRADPS